MTEFWIATYKSKYIFRYILKFYSFDFETLWSGKMGHSGKIVDFWNSKWFHEFFWLHCRIFNDFYLIMKNFRLLLHSTEEWSVIWWKVNKLEILQLNRKLLLTHFPKIQHLSAQNPPKTGNTFFRIFLNILQSLNWFLS